MSQSQRITRNSSKACNLNIGGPRVSLSNSSSVSSSSLHNQLLAKLSDIKSSILNEIGLLKDRVISLEDRVSDLDNQISAFINMCPIDEGNSHPETLTAAAAAAPTTVVSRLPDQRSVRPSPTRPRPVVLSSISGPADAATPADGAPILSASDRPKHRAVLLTNCSPSATCESVCRWIKCNAAFTAEEEDQIRCVDLSAKRRSSGTMTYASFKLLVPENCFPSLVAKNFWPIGTIVKEFINKPSVGFRKLKTQQRANF